MTTTESRAVLIAEDEVVIRQLISMLFEIEQFKVFQANDGEEAWNLFDNHADEIDLLITDLGLPKLEGVKLIAKVRARKPGVKIIGSSGYGGANAKAEVLRAGGDEFMPKPYTAADIVIRAKQLLGDS